MRNGKSVLGAGKSIYNARITVIEYKHIKHDTDLFQISQCVCKCFHGISDFQGDSAKEIQT